MIKELFTNLFKTKTTTMNVIIVIVVCTFCFTYIFQNVYFLIGDKTIQVELLNKKDDMLNGILMIGLGALAKQGYDLIKQQQ